jgi:hypothetical protein
MMKSACKADAHNGFAQQTAKGFCELLWIIRRDDAAGPAMVEDFGALSDFCGNAGEPGRSVLQERNRKAFRCGAEDADVAVGKDLGYVGTLAQHRQVVPEIPGGGLGH